jgi:hypothetical protein
MLRRHFEHQTAPMQSMQQRPHALPLSGCGIAPMREP